jgi:hypothetical protein
VNHNKPIDIDYSSDLSNFFSLVNSEKKKKKERFQSLVGDLNIESIFEEVKTLKKKDNIKKKKEEKSLEIFESWLYDENPVEEVQEIVDSIVEEPETPQEEPTLIERSLGLLAEPSNVNPGIFSKIE